jgi:hypothetical protein
VFRVDCRLTGTYVFSCNFRIARHSPGTRKIRDPQMPGVLDERLGDYATNENGRFSVMSSCMAKRIIPRRK